MQKSIKTGENWFEFFFPTFMFSRNKKANPTSNNYTFQPFQSLCSISPLLVFQDIQTHLQNDQQIPTKHIKISRITQVFDVQETFVVCSRSQRARNSESRVMILNS